MSPEEPAKSGAVPEQSPPASTPKGVTTGIDADILNLLDRWYQAYHTVSVFIGTAAATLFLVTVSALFERLTPATAVREAILQQKPQLTALFILLAVCLLATLACVLTTYNWYVSGLSKLLLKSNPDLNEYLGDPFKYRTFMGSMKPWGVMSLLTGWLSGIALGVAVVLEALLFIRAFEALAIP